jgi:parallel beta-helix repeat protein
MNRIVPVLIILGLAASPAGAATYYISQSGNDSNSCQSAQGGSPSRHRLTIGGALECLSAGDTLYIHGGTYTGWKNAIDSQSFNVPSGTSFGNAVTIAGYPGEQVTLQPPFNLSGIRLTVGSPHHLILQDFTIDMANSSAGADAAGIILYTAHHIRFERLDVKNSPTFGVHFGDHTPYNEMLNCRIHDNGYRGDSASNGHGLYISSSNNVFDGNEVYNNQGYGFHVYNNWGSHADPSNNIVSNNQIFRNGLHGPPGYGVVFAWGEGNVARDNTIYDNAGGIQVYTYATATKIYNNTIHHNTTEGIALQYYGSPTTVTGNSVYSNGLNIQDYGGFSGLAMIRDNFLEDR